MDLETGSHEYILKKPIMVHFAGEGEKEVISLELREPGYEHAKKAYRIEQMVSKCIYERIQDMDHSGTESVPLHDQKSEDIEKNAAEMVPMIKAALRISETVDLGDFVETFVKMATKNNAKKPIIMCDGKIPFKDSHIEQMGTDEILNLAAVWTAFFGMPSEDQE